MGESENLDFCVAWEYNQFDKLEFDEQLSHAPKLAMFSGRVYIDNYEERR